MPEQRFKQFATQFTQEQFADATLLEAEAKKYLTSDPELAKKIQARADALKENQKKYQALQLKIEQEKKENQIEANKIDADKKPVVVSMPEPKIEIPSMVSPSKSLKRKEKTIKEKAQGMMRSGLFIFIFLPTFIFSIYQLLIASPRYESQSQLIVQQPDSMATMDASMAILSGLGGGASSTDTELVKAYIYSSDMVAFLNQELNLREHYSESGSDYFSRFHSDESKEAFLEYYKKHITVAIDEKSGVITVLSQAFTPEKANQITKKIVARAEWYINSIGHHLASEQLTFIKKEHELVELRLQEAQSQLLNFQRKHSLLDPTAEGASMQQITYSIEGELATKETELKALTSIMSLKAPQVVAIKNEIKALKNQLKIERSKLTESGKATLSVSEILSKYTDLKIKVELALQGYTSSQVSLEKSRIEAYRQIKYLIVVEKATVPESHKYPDTFYNITLFFALSLIIFAIGRIITMTIQELR
ncbi:capsular polysaccharide ABC transporter, inner membrane protein KpsE [Aliivibrio wodanis]|uniref:Capsular polysaccharide ABC transporter, inner membrane protein KpsE n=1 Tax=Aliivibrio wodanis TaxID=80852 RepID=A0A090IM30_9GAMM|nr:capsular polysaccharide ABC transporter, inner membrane protein KpsE [Aliivibrio wodanis]